MINSTTLIVVGILAAVALLISFVKGGKIGMTNAPVTKLFVQNPRNDKVIIVKGWSENQLKKILGDF